MSETHNRYFGANNSCGYFLREQSSAKGQRLICELVFLVDFFDSLESTESCRTSHFFVETKVKYFNFSIWICHNNLLTILEEKLIYNS